MEDPPAPAAPAGGVGPAATLPGSAAMPSLARNAGKPDLGGSWAVERTAAARTGALVATLQQGHEVHTVVRPGLDALVRPGQRIQLTSHVRVSYGEHEHVPVVLGARPAPAPHGDAPAAKRARPAPSVCPIEHVNAGIGMNVCIEGVVRGKSEQRTTSRGGVFFYCELRDETATIRVAAFDKACEVHHTVLEEGARYRLQRVRVRQRGRGGYNQTDHPFELTLLPDTMVQLLAAAGPPARSVLVRDAQVSERHTIMGVVIHCSPEVHGPKGARRRVTVADEGDAAVEVTVFDAMPQPALGAPVCMENVRFGEYRGGFQATTSARSVRLGVALPASTLQWWSTTTPATHERLLLESRRAPEGTLERVGAAPLMHVTCELVNVLDEPRETHPMRHLCCANCQRRLVMPDEKDVRHECDSCLARCPGVWRWFLHTTWTDATGSRRLTMFDDVAEVVVGRPAESTWAASASGDDVARAIRARASRWHLLCEQHARERDGESFEDIICRSAHPGDAVRDGRKLLARIAHVLCA